LPKLCNEQNILLLFR